VFNDLSPVSSTVPLKEQNSSKKNLRANGEIEKILTLSMTQEQILRPQQFRAIESGNPFLELFPHRYDYIRSPHGGIRPSWTTVSTHTLSDRLIEQGAYLYGVRFGATTSYAMIDIDRGSAYHPNADPFAINRLTSALETQLGLIDHIAITSSYSGGLHLYFPLSQPIASWKIAESIALVVEASGFKVKDGQLEIFPNNRNQHQLLYKAHRLPLQMGSYILNENFEPIGQSESQFVAQWEFAQRRSGCTEEECDRALKRLKRNKYALSTKAESFLNDLNAEIETGWTGPGQTNHLLGRIAQRSYIFGHIIHSLDRPLTGRALIEEMVSIAIALPGYQDYCSHQHEIYDRAAEWANCIENKSKYFPCGFGSASKNSSKDGNSWNQLNAELARDRIRYAIEALTNQDALKTGITDRYNQLKSFGIGGETLYKYLDLWHPEHLNISPSPNKLPNTQKSLVGSAGRDTNNYKGFNDRSAPDNPEIARDIALDKALRDFKSYDRLPAWQGDRAAEPQPTIPK
jgi:hypothetical protein